MRRPRRTQFRSSEAGGHRNRPWGNASSVREAQDDEPGTIGKELRSITTQRTLLAVNRKKATLGISKRRSPTKCAISSGKYRKTTRRRTKRPLQKLEIRRPHKPTYQTSDQIRTRPYRPIAT